jgi:hypothetical protein
VTVDSNSTPSPVISSFSESHEYRRGQNATLSWNISGAAAISIDNAVGNVSGMTSTVATDADYHV